MLKLTQARCQLMAVPPIVQPVSSSLGQVTHVLVLQ
jgi:hypothetical protein